SDPRDRVIIKNKGRFILYEILQERERASGYYMNGGWTGGGSSTYIKRHIIMTNPDGENFLIAIPEMSETNFDASYDIIKNNFQGRNDIIQKINNVGTKNIRELHSMPFLRSILDELFGK
ncbi:MAG: hypothetical protein ACO29O_09635, partial [Chitinophagaceae bacterium]